MPCCLHLKTACAALRDGRLLVNPAWLDTDALRSFTLLPIPDAEPWAANLALLGDTIITSSGHPRTAELITNHGFDPHLIDLSEFAKAEGRGDREPRSPGGSRGSGRSWR